jgi:hypothetical protein
MLTPDEGGAVRLTAFSFACEKDRGGGWLAVAGKPIELRSVLCVN